MSRITPRNVLITGASQRIGRSIAIDLAREGWSVALHYGASADAAQSVVTEIAATGGRAVALQADLAQENQTSDLISRATEAVGPITCLVNNAARFEHDTVYSVTRDSWDLHLETNLRAPFVLIQEFARALPDNTDGVVINVIDERVWNLTPHFVSYTLSKAGLWTLTQTLALALAPRIRVNAIGPGPTLPSPRQTDAQFARQSDATPLKRGTTPEEICEAVRFILAASALTGQMIALDGGQHLGWRQGTDDPEE
jgi:NAD(P)-dependent dehydrogenase (short-subunit alcohol dehydrogenase family)